MSRRVLMLALVLAATGSASAQRAATVEDEYARTIRDALQEAHAAHWEEARALFERAHELAPSARTLRGLGIAAFELRHYVQAIRELDAALVDARNPLTAEQRAEAQSAITRARRYVGTVRVRLLPQHATLRLDGVELAERTLLLEVGDYRLIASAAGYRDAEHLLRVAGGQVQDLELALARSDLSPPPNAAARPGAPDAALTTSAQDREQDDGSLLERWWFWTAVGVVVAGGAVAAIAVIGDEGDQPERGLGGRIAVLRVAP